MIWNAVIWGFAIGFVVGTVVWLRRRLRREQESIDRRAAECESRRGETEWDRLVCDHGHPDEIVTDGPEFVMPKTAVYANPARSEGPDGWGPA